VRINSGREYKNCGLVIWCSSLEWSSHRFCAVVPAYASYLLILSAPEPLVLYAVVRLHQISFRLE
jgi:hypothetical protein